MLSACGTLTITKHPFGSRVLPPAARELACAKGAAQVVHQHKNMITDAGLDALVAMLAGGFNNPAVGGVNRDQNTILDVPNGTGHWIKFMHVTDAPAPSVPSAADTTLDGEEKWIGVVDPLTPTMTVSYPATGTVAFQSTIPFTSEFDGIDFTEEGLFTADGVLVARKTFPAVSISLGVLSIQFDHEIQIARA